MEFRLDALFRYVVKDRALAEFYSGRREQLVAEAEADVGGGGEVCKSGCECTDCDDDGGGVEGARSGYKKARWFKTDERKRDNNNDSRSVQSRKKRRYNRN